MLTFVDTMNIIRVFIYCFPYGLAQQIFFPMGYIMSPFLARRGKCGGTFLPCMAPVPALAEWRCPLKAVRKTEKGIPGFLNVWNSVPFLFPKLTFFFDLLCENNEGTWELQTMVSLKHHGDLVLMMLDAEQRLYISRSWVLPSWTFLTLGSYSGHGLAPWSYSSFEVAPNYRIVFKPRMNNPPVYLIGGCPILIYSNSSNLSLSTVTPPEKNKQLELIPGADNQLDAIGLRNCVQSRGGTGGPSPSVKAALHNSFFARLRWTTLQSGKKPWKLDFNLNLDLQYLYTYIYIYNVYITYIYIHTYIRTYVTYVRKDRQDRQDRQDPTDRQTDRQNRQGTDTGDRQTGQTRQRETGGTDRGTDRQRQTVRQDQTDQDIHTLHKDTYIHYIDR